MTKLIIVSLLLLAARLPAQDNTPMRVIHCSAVDQQSRVDNIYVDGSNVKYVSADGKLFRLFSADNAGQDPLKEDQWYLLNQKEGNYPLTVSTAEMETLLPALPGDTMGWALPEITTTFYHPKTRHLWIGTASAGLYQLQADVNVRLIDHFHTGNSKLRSNRINSILCDKYGRQWIGTEEGVLFGENGKWKLYEKRDRILAITALGPDVWILAEGILWRVDERNRWLPGDVDPRLAKGEIRDITYDSEGRLWVASDVITRYDVVHNRVEEFGSAQGFTSRKVSCIRTDAEDALWVGTLDKGLFLIEKEAVMSVSCEVEQGPGCTTGAREAALQVKVYGGKPPYTYSWTDGLKGAQPRQLGPGVYYVTVTDATRQSRTAAAKVEGGTLKITTEVSQKESRPGAEDGRAIAQAAGGAPAYSFQWDNGENGPIAQRLGAGLHHVTVTDRFGCEEVAGLEVERVPPPEPEKVVPLTVQLTQSIELLCPDDRQAALKASVSGGKGPYSFQWNDPACEGETPGRLGPGQYRLTVTDALGSSTAEKIMLQAPSPINIRLQEVEPAGNKNSRDGKASATVSGGKAPYVLLWDNGETSGTASRLSAGRHTVSVSDANGCEKTASIQMSEKIIPELDLRTLTSGQVVRINRLYFAADSTFLSDSSVPALNELYQFLQKNPGVTVEVGGHTNGIPEHDFCDKLSTERAKSVAEYIVQKGIDSDRVQYRGYGKRKPVATNRTPEGRRKNQRVEIKILRLKG